MIASENPSEVSIYQSSPLELRHSDTYQCDIRRLIGITQKAIMLASFRRREDAVGIYQTLSYHLTLVDLMKSCVLLMKLPCTEGESWRIGEAIRSEGDSLFLLGDAVASCRREYRGHSSSIVSGALRKGAKVSASARDLRARGIQASELHEGIKIIEDIEGDFIDVTMDLADRVIAW